MRILFFVLLILGISSNSWAEQNNSSLAEKKAAPFISAPVISVDSKVKKKQSVTFESLAQLDELIKLGVPALALSLLEDEQKNRQPFTVDWYALDRKSVV